MNDNRTYVYLVTVSSDKVTEAVLYAFNNREAAQSKIEKLKADDPLNRYFIDVVQVLSS